MYNGVPEQERLLVLYMDIQGEQYFISDQEFGSTNHCTNVAENHIFT